MDMQVALISVGLCVVSAAVVYLISVFGMKEKTYEEAIEEQRKRNQEALLNATGKSDKPKKEKKFKKLGSSTTKKTKDASSAKNSHSEDSEGNKGTNEGMPAKSEKLADHHVDKVEFKPEAEIIPLEATPDLNTVKTVKTGKKKTKSSPAPKSILINKQDPIPLNANAKLSTSPMEDEDTDDSPVSDLPVPSFVPKDEVERRHSMDFATSAKKPVQLLGSAAPVSEPTVKIETKKKDDKKEPAEESPSRSAPQSQVAKPAKDDQVNNSPTKKIKKGKSDETALVSPTETEISGKKLLQLLKGSPIQDDEIHQLIEVLLNKQQHEGSSEWTKKNDPVATLKKQLTEREQALEVEQRQYQAVNAKLREVRIELGQEKTKSSTSERALKEKLAQQIQETQALRARHQHSHEQQLAEIGALQNKCQQASLQSKVNDEQSAALQHLSEENGKLQQKLSRLEAERQSLSNSEKQLQVQLKQLQGHCEHYEAAQVTHQQKIETYEIHLKQLQTSKQEDEYKFAQTIAELSQKAGDSENLLNAVNKELQHAKAIAGAGESDRMNMASRLEQVESTSRLLEDEISLLKPALENEKAAAHEVRLRLEHTQSQVAIAAAQQSEANKITVTLREENERLKSQLAQLSVRTAAEGQEANNPIQQKLEKQTTSPDLSKALEDKENELTKVGEELKQKLSSINGLTGELEEQKKKNNELREKNWKAMEALNEAEKAKAAALAKGSSTEDLERRLQEAQGKIQEAQKMKDDIYQKLRGQQLLDRDLLQRLLPDVKLDNKMEQTIWVENFVNEVSQKISKAGPTLPLSPPITPGDANGKVINGETTANDSKLIHLKSENSSLQAQINHYKTVLAETEDILKKLQSGVEAEEAKWREKLSEKDRLLNKALEEKAKLEKNLEELQGVEEATAEMQSKLKELQAKLQGEENEKKSLGLKVDQVNKAAEDLKQQLQEKTKELDALAEERKALTKAKEELEGIRSQLEEERKISKDLNSQTVKLNSLVKIGQDALRAEQELVKAMQTQLDQQKQNGTSALISEVSESSPKPSNGQQRLSNSLNEADSSCVSSAAFSASSTSSSTASTTPISSNPVVKSEKSSKHKKRGASGKK